MTIVDNVDHQDGDEVHFDSSEYHEGKAEYMITSEPAVDGRAALVAADQADDITSLSIGQYVAALDFLIITLTRAVGTRPSPLENAMPRMFQNAKWDDQKLRKVMQVSAHKQQEDRPGPIPMTADTEYLLNKFSAKLRPLVTDEEDPSAKIFLKYSAGLVLGWVTKFETPFLFPRRY